jgi:hypothetical protein
MTTQQQEGTPRGSRRHRALTITSLVAGGVIAGAALAGTLSATAATTPSPSTTSSTSAGTPSTQGAGGDARQGGPGPGGSTPVRSDEKSVSSSIAATLTAAAQKAVPGGTVYWVETDAGDAAYEAHVRKSDGTLVTVKFAKDLTVSKVETGMGQGDPAPAGRPSGAGQAGTQGQPGTAAGAGA